MLSQILDALDFIHTRDPPIIHRDIKPANILYRGDKFLLTDFGIAKIVDTSTTMVGSCWYVAPEVRLSCGQTPEVDIYGLGATAVECLVELLPETERASKWPYWEQWHQELRSLLNEHASPYAPMVADNAEHRFSARELLDTFNRPAHIPSRPQANVGWTSLGLSMQQEANQSMTGNSAPPSPMDCTQTGAIAIFRGIPRPVLEDTTVQPWPTAVPSRNAPPDPPAQTGTRRRGSVKSARSTDERKGQRRNRSSWNGRRGEPLLVGVAKRTSRWRPGPAARSQEMQSFGMS